MTTFVYRLQYLPYQDPTASEITDVSKRRWSIKRGDILLFTDGTGAYTRFIGTAKVQKATRTARDPGGRDQPVVHVTQLIVEEFTPLPNDRLLESFQYSLRKVANFSRPSLHFRHRSTVPDEDLEILRSGTIHAERSLFFGLLRHLPHDWRSYFEHIAAARSVLVNGVTPEYEDLPVDDLLRLLTKYAVEPVALAGELAPTIRRVLDKTDHPHRPIMAFHQPNQQSKNEGLTRGLELTRLTGEAGRLRRQIGAGWENVRVMQEWARTQRTQAPRGQEEEAKWRPHKW